MEIDIMTSNNYFENGKNNDMTGRQQYYNHPDPTSQCMHSSIVPPHSRGYICPLCGTIFNGAVHTDMKIDADPLMKFAKDILDAVHTDMEMNADPLMKFTKDILDAIHIEEDFLFKIDFNAEQERKLIELADDYNNKSEEKFRIFLYPSEPNTYMKYGTIEIAIFNIIDALCFNTKNIKDFLYGLYSLNFRNFTIVRNKANEDNYNNNFKFDPDPPTNNKKKIFVFQVMITSKNSDNVWTFLDLFSKKFKNSIYQVNTDRDGRYTCYCEYSEEIVKSIKTLSTIIHEKIQTEVI